MQAMDPQNMPNMQPDPTQPGSVQPVYPTADTGIAHQQPITPLAQHQAMEQFSQSYLKENPLAAMQEGEEVIADIRRHPFGIVSLYFFSFIGLVAACGVIVLLIPKLLGSNATFSPMELSIGLIGIIVLLMLLGLGVTTTIYWQNRWILTSDSITQITQRSLFNRQVSQLSLGNLEDVTAEQRGIIPNMFNFGTLKVETAGERSKFYFLYCPDPNLYARKILMAREIFLQNGGSRGM